MGLLITTCNWQIFPTIFGGYLACALPSLLSGHMANGDLVLPEFDYIYLCILKANIAILGCK